MAKNKDRENKNNNFALNPILPKRNKISYAIYSFFKRLIDIIASILGLVLLSPLFLIIAILIKANDGGPALFTHKRVGKNGKEIKVYKFRSMVPDSDNLEKWLNDEQLHSFKTEFKVADDPRITKIGNFLRKSSLDELPQFLNILKGELSIVGPRPIVEREFENYGECREKLLSVKPGLTGYWQAYARNNVTYENGERQYMELYYIDHQSMWFDIKIFFKTFLSVIKRTGAE